MGNTPLDQPLPAGVSSADAVAELIELRRLSSRIEAGKAELIEAIRVDDEANEHRLILGLDKPADGTEMLERLVRAEVSCALRVSSSVAQGMVREARALCDRLPRTLAGLRSGELPVHFARIIIREHFTVRDDRVDAFEAAVFAGRMDVASATFRTRCRRIADRCRPATIDERHAIAVTARRACQVVCVSGRRSVSRGRGGFGRGRRARVARVLASSSS